ncbi:hypothetical protein ACFU7Y_26280, partial [Kitasatospora sp. NPDC057542]
MAGATDTDIVLGAITLAQAATTTPFPGITRTVYQDADRTWTVNVMDIDPSRAPITFDGSIGQGMYTTQTVQEMLEQTTGVTSRRPYLGVNGGYFDDGVVLDQANRIYLGDLGGTSVKNGRLLSEAGGGRYVYDPVTGKAVGLRPANSVLMLQNGRPYITELGTKLTVQLSDDATTDDDPGVEVLFNSAGVATACFRPGATPGGIVSDARRAATTCRP